MTSSSDSSSLYTSTVQPGPSLLMQHFAPPSPLNLLSPFRPFCIFSLTSASCSWLSLYTSCFLFPLILSGLFNGMPAVSKPEALNCYTFFRLIPLTIFVSRNLTLTHLFLFGSLDSLLCHLIAPTPGLALSLLMPGTLAAASSSSSGRAFPFLNFLRPLFLRLIPTLIM